MGELVELANEYFDKKGIVLENSETKLLDGVEDGIEVDYRTGDKKIDDPANAKDWGIDRTIRAEVISWLCTDKKTRNHILNYGLHIYGARIDGTIRINFAIIEFPFGIYGSSIPKGISLEHTNMKALSLNGSHIGIDDSSGRRIFSGDNMGVVGNVNFQGTIFRGEVKLVGAKIAGQLNCKNSYFLNENGLAFFGDGMNVNGNVIFENAKFEGETSLMGTQFDSQFDCENASFKNLSSNKNPNIKAFAGDGMTIKQIALFDKAVFIGETRFIGAEIGGQLSCRGSSFINPAGIAFFSDRLKVGGHVIFDNKARFEGSVFLMGAEIEGQLICSDSSLENATDNLLILQSARVKGVIFLNKLNITSGIINLVDVSAGTLIDDDNNWNNNIQYILDGFTYERIHCDNPKLLTAKARLRWLACQPNDRFHPQPYDQLAKVFRNMGQESEARAVLYEKYKLRRKIGGLKWYSKAWNWLLEKTTGYGYKMWKPLVISSVIIIIGLIILGVTGCYGDMTFIGTPQQQMEMKFCPFVYSIDTFLPVVDLHQEKYWLPNVQAEGCLGDIAYGYLILHILLGWVLTTLVLASLSNIVRRE